LNRNFNEVPVLNPDDDVMKYIFPSADLNDISGIVPYCVDSVNEKEIGCDFDLCNKICSYK